MKWEYKVIVLPTTGEWTDDQKLLDSEGEQGWELVHMVGPGPTCYFKRPLPDNSSQQEARE